MIDILFVTDYVCPYCILAKEALRRALEQTGLTAKITYQPLLLKSKPQARPNPNNPEFARRIEMLTSAGRTLDLDMKMPPRVDPRPVTKLAFEGWHYACEQGKGDEYADRMYRAYFIDEMDIGNIEVLRSLAEQIGLNGEEYVRALNEGTYAAITAEKDRASREVYEVKGVPTLFINGERTELDEYTVDEMVAILEGHAAKSDGISCGEDGCK